MRTLMAPIVDKIRRYEKDPVSYEGLALREPQC